ncbi:MAG: glycosyltransferase family 4 protein [Candidatus Brocadiia bacterium]
MKILQTDFHRGWGGQAASVLTLARGLERLGHEVTVAAPADSELYRRAVRAGLDAFGGLSYRRGFGRHNFQDVRAVRRLVRRDGFDIVHAHGSMDGWIACLALLGMRRRPLMVRTRYDLEPIKPHLLNRWYFGSRIAHLVAVSESIRSRVVEDGLVGPGRVTAIPSPPDLAPFLAGGDGAAFRADVGIPADATVITTVARLAPEKGVDLLVEAFAELAPRYLRARLVICGSGRKVELQLIELSARLGIEDRVCRCGFRDDVPDVLAATDVYVLPSRAEGLGFSLLEAMASGCPVVATRVGGVPEIVTPERDGLLVEPEAPHALAQAIARLLDDPRLRARLAAEGRKTVQQRFATDKLVARVEALYRELVARRQPPAPQGDPHA